MLSGPVTFAPLVATRSFVDASLYILVALFSFFFLSAWSCLGSFDIVLIMQLCCTLWKVRAFSFLLAIFSVQGGKNKCWEIGAHSSKTLQAGMALKYACVCCLMGQCLPQSSVQVILCSHMRLCCVIRECAQRFVICSFSPFAFACRCSKPARRHRRYFNVLQPPALNNACNCGVFVCLIKRRASEALVVKHRQGRAGGVLCTEQIMYKNVD